MKRCKLIRHQEKKLKKQKRKDERKLKATEHFSKRLYTMPSSGWALHFSDTTGTTW